VIDVDRDGWTKGLQLNIAKLDENGTGSGYRLAGPKCNGSSTNLLRRVLDARDAAEIRAALDDVFPQPALVENYDGELAMLRGVLGVIRAIARHGDLGDTEGGRELRRIVAEHYADERDAMADAAEGEVSS